MASVKDVGQRGGSDRHDIPTAVKRNRCSIPRLSLPTLNAAGYEVCQTDRARERSRSRHSRVIPPGTRQFLVGPRRLSIYLSIYLVVAAGHAQRVFIFYSDIITREVPSAPAETLRDSKLTVSLCDTATSIYSEWEGYGGG